jgi:transcriptional regulator with XRE-family HTH domain
LDHEDYKVPTPHHPSAAIQRAMRTLGNDIRDARKRRQLPMSIIAERAFTSRSTLQRIEQGDPGVGIGIYAAVLHALGLLDGLAGLAAISNDTVGQAMSSAALPKRVHLKTRTKGF